MYSPVRSSTATRYVAGLNAGGSNVSFVNSAGVLRQSGSARDVVPQCVVQEAETVQIGIGGRDGSHARRQASISNRRQRLVQVDLDLQLATSCHEARIGEDAKLIGPIL